MTNETRIKCDRNYDWTYDRRGILPVEAKSTAIRKIARFYDMLKNPYVWICDDGIQKLCYLESINLYRWDPVHEQLYEDISGPGVQWESVHLNLHYKKNDKIVDCYRQFKVNILGEMNETFSQLIEESDVRIPNQWDLSNAEFDEGIPVLGGVEYENK